LAHQRVSLGYGSPPAVKPTTDEPSRQVYKHYQPTAAPREARTTTTTTESLAASLQYPVDLLRASGPGRPSEGCLPRAAGGPPPGLGQRQHTRRPL